MNNPPSPGWGVSMTPSHVCLARHYQKWKLKNENSTSVWSGWEGEVQHLDKLKAVRRTVQENKHLMSQLDWWGGGSAKCKECINIMRNATCWRPEPLITVLLWNPDYRKWFTCYSGCIGWKRQPTRVTLHHSAHNWLHMHTGHGVTDEYTPLEQWAELFITALHFGAPCMSLWCRWAASASAGVLFIYTSYKSVSPDLQHKLHQASRELACERVYTHTQK